MAKRKPPYIEELKKKKAPMWERGERDNDMDPGPPPPSKSKPPMMKKKPKKRTTTRGK